MILSQADVASVFLLLLLFSYTLWCTSWRPVDQNLCFTVSARSDVSTWECIVQGPQQLNPEAEDDDGIHKGLNQSFS